MRLGLTDDQRVFLQLVEVWTGATTSSRGSIEANLPADVASDLAGSASGDDYYLRLALVAEQLGRVLSPSNIVHDVAATGALLAPDDAPIPGATKRTWVHLTSVRVEAGRDGGAVTRVLSGSGVAPHAESSASVSVFIHHGEFICLADLPISAVGIQVVPTRSLDGTAARVTFDRVDLTDDVVVASGEDASERHDRTRSIGAALTAAETSGIAHAAVDIALEHARSRHQFGRPIGTFQAIRHFLADMAVDRDATQMLVYQAACALDSARQGRTSWDDAAQAAAVAKCWADGAGRRICARAHQILGAKGYTWEHSMHRYTRRARTNEVWFGSSRELLPRLAHHVLAPQTSGAAS